MTLSKSSSELPFVVDFEVSYPYDFDRTTVEDATDTLSAGFCVKQWICMLVMYAGTAKQIF